MVYWLYTGVTHPMLINVALVLWKALTKKCHIKPLVQVQHLCLLGITGAMTTIRTKLKVAGHWKYVYCYYGYAIILDLDSELGWDRLVMRPGKSDL